MDLTKLREPFPSEDIEFRIQSSGKKGDKIWALVLAYVTNRAIQDRLDSVCGPENWQNEFAVAPGGGVLCGISIRCEHGWVTKWDGADNTDIEAVKGGLSGAMKRAGSQWNIGRYLYKLPTGWAVINQNGSRSNKLKDNTWFKWDPPELPSWALPEKTEEQKKNNAVDAAIKSLERTGSTARTRQDAPRPTKTPDPAHTSEGERIAALKVKLGKKMAEMSNSEKKEFYGWFITDKKETPIVLQGFIDNYDQLLSSYVVSQEATA